MQRIVPTSYPVAFRIADFHHNMSGATLPSEVLLSARLDADGDAATRQPGDLAGRAAQPARPGQTNVLITLQ